MTTQCKLLENLIAFFQYLLKTSYYNIKQCLLQLNLGCIHMFNTHKYCDNTCEKSDNNRVY